MKFRFSILLSALALTLPAFISGLWGQTTATVTTLHSFTGSSTDGAGPSGLIQGSDGNFYGTTAGGGGSGSDGTIFRLTSAGVLSTLNTAGSGNALVEGRDGNFYGTTSSTIFRVTPAGVLTTLYSFPSGTDEATCYAGLVQGNDGSFYGTTAEGGNSKDGTVFRVTPAGVLTTLHSFTGSPDGKYPLAALVQGSDGNFYGTTEEGGSSNDGTVFQITPTGVLATLHSFTNTGMDGEYPQAGLIQGSDSNFYGTATGGINGNGVVFRITSAGVLTTLHSFTGSDGNYPAAALVQGSDGTFYGTTEEGGTSNDGTVFQITPVGVLSTLYSFSAHDGNYENADGAYPFAGLVQGSDGNFYGATYEGGVSRYGTVFKLEIPHLGIDVSDSQDAIDWSQVASAGKTFAYVKATSGLLTTDQNFPQNMQNARTAGLTVGAYHFGYPGYTAAHTAENEAAYFIQTASNFLTPGNLRPALDIEDDKSKNFYPENNLGYSGLAKWIADFSSAIKQYCGADIVIYTDRTHATGLVPLQGSFVL